MNFGGGDGDGVVVANAFRQIKSVCNEYIYVYPLKKLELQFHRNSLVTVVFEFTSDKRAF